MAQTVYQYGATFYTTLNAAIDKIIDDYAKCGRYRDQIAGISQKIIPVNACRSKLQLTFETNNRKKFRRTVNAIELWGGERYSRNLLSDYQASLEDEKRRESKK
jgi:hypothetical protein